MKKADYIKLLEDAGIEHDPSGKAANLKALAESHGLVEAAPAAVGEKTVHNGTIEISMTITTADGAKHKDSIAIANPVGCMPKHRTCDAGFIVESMKQELSDRFGPLHVR